MGKVRSEAPLEAILGWVERAREDERARWPQGKASSQAGDGEDPLARLSSLMRQAVEDAGALTWRRLVDGLDAQSAPAIWPSLGDPLAQLAAVFAAERELMTGQAVDAPPASAPRPAAKVAQEMPAASPAAVAADVQVGQRERGVQAPQGQLDVLLEVIGARPLSGPARRGAAALLSRALAGGGDEALVREALALLIHDL